MLAVDRESDPLLSKPADSTPPNVSHSIFDTLTSLSVDAKVLLASKVVRMFSYGILAVILMIYLQTLHFTDAEIGLLFTLILAGDAVLSIILTTHADRWGRRFTLILGSIIAIVTSFVFATSTNFSVLLVAGVLGVISPSGSELGPFMAIEISALSEISYSAQRTALMAWYNLLGSLAAAFGALVCGYILHYLQFNAHFSIRKSAQLALILYTLIQCGQLALFYRLTPRIEARQQPSNAPQQPGFLGIHKSRQIVLVLCILFAMDSFGGSFVLQSIVSTWFFNTYHTDTLLLGSIVFWCNIAAGISSLYAVYIAQRIGLILTMFVTHLPSNILLILVPLMPSETWAIAMLCLRYTISQMDVPTRNAYVQGVVSSDERSATNGITLVAKSIGACMGPVLAGKVMSGGTGSWMGTGGVFYIAGGVKIVYDVLLLYNFMSLKSDSDVVFPAERNGAGSSDKGVELGGKV